MIMTRVSLLWAVALLVALPGCTGGEQAETAGEAADVVAQKPGTMVHLFEWPWESVALECEQFLGPAGYASVQVSPPTENHIVGGRPWWERYQPVSYQFETRSGTREEFADMVARCDAVGVDIIVDAVINHMTDADLEHPEVTFTARGTAGTEFSSYEYPGLYSYEDFHHCGLTPNDDIQDFSDQEQMQRCELVDLADLATETQKVRVTLAGYLEDLKSLGVAGLRIDAALHMSEEDIRAILEEAGWDGYVVQEVSQPREAARYLGNGAVTNFEFGRAVSEGIREGSLSEMVSRPFWESPHHDSGSSLVFVDNHDTQRHGQGVLNYKSERYPMAVAMMLAVGYGKPRVMSGFAFDDTAAGPPSDDEAQILPVHEGTACVGGWLCEHRRPLTVGMVGFEAATRGEPVTRIQEAGPDRVAFGRGDRGWVAFNRSAEPWEVVHQMGLPGTSYCDVAQGKPSEDGSCAGGTVRVDAGMVSATVPPGGVVAIHVEAQAAN